MTFLLEWDFSVVAELCPQIPSLLSEKKKVSAAFNSLGPLGSLVQVSAMLRPGSQKTNPPQLPSCVHNHPGHCSGWQSVALLGHKAHLHLKDNPCRPAPANGAQLSQKIPPCWREARKRPWQPFKGRSLSISLKSNYLQKEMWAPRPLLCWFCRVTERSTHCCFCHCLTEQPALLLYMTDRNTERFPQCRWLILKSKSDIWKLILLHVLGPSYVCGSCRHPMGRIKSMQYHRGKMFVKLFSYFTVK